MKNLLAALLLTIALPAFAAEKVPSDEESPPDATVEITPDAGVKFVDPPTSPVVRLVTDKGGTFCTGFLVSPRYIATAGHCLANHVGTITAVADNGLRIKVMPAVVSNPDAGLADFGLLFMTDLEAIKWKPAKLDCSGEQYPVTTPLYVKGFPGLDTEEVYSEGYIHGPNHILQGSFWRKPLIHVTLPIYKGHSGSAVWNKTTGEVIGLLVGFAGNSQPAWAFLQPIKAVCAALNE